MKKLSLLGVCILGAFLSVGLIIMSSCQPTSDVASRSQKAIDSELEHSFISNSSFESDLNGYYFKKKTGSVYLYNSIDNIHPTDGKKFLYISCGPGDQGNDLKRDSIVLRTDPFQIDKDVSFILVDLKVLSNEMIINPYARLDTVSIYLVNSDPSDPYPNRGSFAYGSVARNTLNLNKVVEKKEHILDHSDIKVKLFTRRTKPIQSHDGSIYDKQTRWITAKLDVSLLAGSTDYYEIGFSVWDGKESIDVDTALLVDNIRVIHQRN